MGDRELCPHVFAHLAQNIIPSLVGLPRPDRLASSPLVRAMAPDGSFSRVRRQSWFVRLAERRPTLVGFLTALLVFRIVTTITEIVEQRIT